MIREFLTSSFWINPQIDFLLWLQNIREATGGLFDNIFLKLTALGETLIPFTVMCVIYWCFSPKSGICLFSLNGISIVAAQIFKTTACIYRPWVLSKNIHPQSLAFLRAGGYSFPSGHSTMASSVFGGMAFLLRKNPVFCSLLVFLVLLIGFSRLYLGVHTPQDVIVGILTGFILAFPMAKLFDWCEKDTNRYLYFLFVFDILACLVLFFICTKSYPADYINGKLLVSPWSAKYTGIIHTAMSLGAINGGLLCRRFFHFEPKKFSKKTKILIGIIGVAIAIFLLHLLDMYVWIKHCDFKVAFTAGFFSTFSLIGIYPFIFTRLLKQK
ncbi:MAG: phosphatase PAP2 family protein [bacterium]|nr:phosphatase PAP2 family protein [bacterium]